MLIRNKSGEAREIPDVGDVEAGATVDVADEVANGTPPTGEEGDPEYRAGTSGLLAQEDVWEKAKDRKTTTDAPSGEEA